MLWIPLTVFAALAQTVRNAAQRHLVASLGTLGATLVRFLYGLPFALVWLGIVAVVSGEPLPRPTAMWAVWVAVGGVAQIAGTALLLRVMTERNFALGVAYSKTELLQVAIFGAVLLGDPLSLATVLAVVLGTLAVLLLSPPVEGSSSIFAAMTAWPPHRTAVLGVLSGAGFAVAAVGYRGATLALSGASAFPAAAATLVAAQTLQTVLLGGWLLVRSRGVVMKVCAPGARPCSRAWPGQRRQSGGSPPAPRAGGERSHARSDRAALRVHRVAPPVQRHHSPHRGGRHDPAGGGGRDRRAVGLAATARQSRLPTFGCFDQCGGHARSTTVRSRLTYTRGDACQA